MGGSRWVVYNTTEQHMDYDPSTVPPEWHGWLHHTTDKLPEQVVRASEGWKGGSKRGGTVGAVGSRRGNGKARGHEGRGA